VSPGDKRKRENLIGGKIFLLVGLNLRGVGRVGVI
jgi:hypothetical protein